MEENKKILRKYLRKYGMENLLHTLCELLEEDYPTKEVYITFLKHNLKHALKEYQGRNNGTRCEYCWEYKTEEKCVGCDQCIYGPDGKEAFTCAGWGPYCCKCGANYARSQLP